MVNYPGLVIYPVASAKIRLGCSLVVGQQNSEPKGGTSAAVFLSLPFLSLASLRIESVWPCYV